MRVKCRQLGALLNNVSDSFNELENQTDIINLLNLKGSEKNLSGFLLK